MFTSIAIVLVLIPVLVGWLMLLAGPIFVLPILGIEFLMELNEKFKTGVDLAPVLKTNRILNKVKVKDDGSILVNFKTAFPDLRTSALTLYNESLMGRKTVGEKLVEAQKLLPNHLKLIIYECYRSRNTEQGFQTDAMNELYFVEPNYDHSNRVDALKKMEDEFLIAGHQTGGAVDVGLIDINGIELDLGRKHVRELKWDGELKESEANQFAKDNRKILSEALNASGFTQYATEWWHWSYGDRYWALAHNKSAIFANI